MTVRLRPLAVEDVDNIMLWINDPEVTRNFARFDHVFSREEEQAYVEKMLASEADKVFSVESGDGTYCGQAGLHQIYWPSRNARAALVIRREMSGRGLGQAALRELLRIAFEEVKLHKVWLVVFRSNEKGRHIYEKCGFRVEGFLRDEYFHRAAFHDMVRMAILEDEWRRPPSA